MKCARCGGEIPEGSPSCPGCGLKIRMRAPVAGRPPPGQQAPPELGQPLPPGGVQITKPYSPGEWPPRDLLVGPSSQPDRVKRKIPKAIIAIIVICLLAIGGAAAYYFISVFPWGKSSGPEATVERFLTAAAKEDLTTLRSLLTPELQSQVMSSYVGSGNEFPGGQVEVKEIKLKTISETDKEAEVEVVDEVVTLMQSGVSMRFSLKDTYLQPNSLHARVKLRKQDGSWLICELPEQIY